jgi:hypothetical protein
MTADVLIRPYPFLAIGSARRMTRSAAETPCREG